jgi:predicted branched-subunit amino acid permease
VQTANQNSIEAQTDSSTSTETTRRLARDGAVDILAIAVGYIPMALAIGAAISQSGLSTFAGWLGGPLLASGTAHLTITNILSSGGSLGAAILAGVLINARLLAYSGGLAPWFALERRSTRLLVGFFTIDATYLMAQRRFQSEDPGPCSRKWYMVGMGVALWSIWSAAMAVGVFVGGGLPDSIGLEWVATFMLVGLLALNLGDRQLVIAASTGVAVALVGTGLPSSVTPLIAAIAAAGIVAAMGANSESVGVDP